MILIINEQDSITIDTARLKADAQCVLDELKYSNFDLSISLIPDDRIHEMNRKFRKKDKVTDILSFPFYPDLKAGERIQLSSDSDDERNLGDIIIAPKHVHSTRDQWNQTFEERMRVLLIHGICHLIGYDHIKDEDYKVMKKEEDRLLAIIKQ